MKNPLFVFIISLLLIHTSSVGHANTGARVLILNSYHPQYSWTESLISGIKNELKNQIPDENIHIEFMDERRFVSDSKYHQKLTDLYQYKYADFNPDLVVTTDDPAFYFLLEHRDRLFKNAQVVFGGVNVFDPKVLDNKPNFTGILEGMEIRKNIELIHRLQPDIKQITLLADKTELGERMALQAQSEIGSPIDNLQIKIWDDFSYEALLKKVSQAQADQAYLILAIHKDKNGRYFSFAEDLEPLTKASKVPIYGMWGGIMLGNGIIGGLINDPVRHGESLGKIAIKVLNGTPASQIPIQTKAEYLPAFDYNQLKHFQIPLSKLPENSRILNEPKSFYHLHKKWLLSGIGFIVFLVAVILTLSINIRRRIKAELSLQTLNQSLEKQVEQRTEALRHSNNELKSMMRELKKLANTDELTKLSNRRAGMLYLTRIMRRCKRNPPGVCIAMVDLDYFKQINDQFGHSVGDNILIQVANCLQNSIRPEDNVYRWGGEEFLIVFNQASCENALKICQRIQQSVQNIFKPDNKAVTLSIGLALQHQNDTFETLIQRADEHLYYAKGNGRARIESADFTSEKL